MNSDSTVSVDDEPGGRKRVGKACDRCRNKKSKCNGTYPCSRCKDENVICVYSDRDKNLDKTWPRGTAETMQLQLNICEMTIYEMYGKMLEEKVFPGGQLENLPGRERPHVYDIVFAMGCMPNEGQLKQICSPHESIADGILRIKDEKPCSKCEAEKAGGMKEPCPNCGAGKAGGMKASESPPQGATNLIPTTEIGDAIKLNGHRRIEQHVRPRPYPTPESGEQSVLHSAAMSRQPSRHVQNSHGDPKDMNGRRHRNSGLTDSNPGTNCGFPPLYNNRESESMLNHRMQHASYGARMGGLDPNLGFDNSATHFHGQNATFGVNATDINPMHFNHSSNSDGSYMAFHNPDVESADPFMGGLPTSQAMSPQIRAWSTQNQFTAYNNQARSSANQPTGAISPAIDGNNGPLGVLGNIDQMPPDPQRAGTNFDRPQDNWDDNLEFPQVYMPELDELLLPYASQEDTEMIDSHIYHP